MGRFGGILAPKSSNHHSISDSDVNVGTRKHFNLRKKQKKIENMQLKFFIFLLYFLGKKNNNIFGKSRLGKGCKRIDERIAGNFLKDLNDPSSLAPPLFQ